VDFEGEHFQFRGLSLLTKPVQKPHPPIWIAADNDKATIRAARMGDSWIINPHATSATLERQMGLYREARQAEGLPMPAEIPLMRELFVSEDRQSALRQAQPYLEQKYKAYREWGQDKVLPTGDHFDHAYPDLLRDRFIIGDPEDCAGQIEDYRERLGANHMIFRIQWPGMDQAKVLRTIELLGKHVFPRFKESN
jgi:alkanesulfonate monooxygenase SsuD/methylene tetrahydromethanopterin reductase-like flavin-dependent oxidoreductase (luciferase family)